MKNKIIKMLLSLMLLFTTISFQTRQVEAETVIDKIYFNASLPVAGEGFFYASDVVTSYDAKYSISDVKLYNSSNVELTYDFHTYVENETYKLVIKVTMESGYTIDTSTKAYVNGTEATLSGNEITYEFNPHSKDEIFTVTYQNSKYGPFKVGGGAYSNHQHAVDVCYFNCPEGKTITGYSIDGVKYTRPKTVSNHTLCKDIVIEPIYDDAALYVEGIKVDASNTADILNDGGTVRYENNILYLDGANIETVPLTIGDQKLNNAIYSTGPLTILINSSSKIIDGSTSEGLKTKAIYSGWDLNLLSQDENAVLEIVNKHASKGYTAIETYRNFNANAAQLTIHNTRQNTSRSDAIYALNKLDIRNGSNISVLMDANETLSTGFGYYETYGIYSSLDLTIHESKVKVVIDDHSEIQTAFEVYDNFIALESEVEVELNGNNQSEAQYGVYSTNFADIYKTLFKMNIKDSAYAMGIRTINGMALEELKEGSVIEVKADIGYALINHDFFDHNNAPTIELIKGQYTIGASSQAIINASFQNIHRSDRVIVTLEEDQDLKYDLDNPDGSSALIWEKPSGSALIDEYASKFLQTTHKHLYTLKSDEDYHFEECACGEVIEKEKHRDSDQDGLCDFCDHEVEVIKEDKKESTSNHDDYVVVFTAVK